MPPHGSLLLPIEAVKCLHKENLLLPSQAGDASTSSYLAKLSNASTRSPWSDIISSFQPGVLITWTKKIDT
jgi:hypothetical protein